MSSWRERRKLVPGVAGSRWAILSKLQPIKQRGQKGDGVLSSHILKDKDIVKTEERTEEQWIIFAGSSASPLSMVVPQGVSHVTRVNCHWTPCNGPSYKLGAFPKYEKMPGFELYSRLLADNRKVKIMSFSFPSLHLYSILLSLSSPSSEPQLERGRSNEKEECLEKLKSCPPGSYNWLLWAVLWLSAELKEELGKCKWFSWHGLQNVSSVTPEIALSMH